MTDGDWMLSLDGRREGSRPIMSKVLNTYLLSWTPHPIVSEVTIAIDRYFSICELEIYSSGTFNYHVIC